MEKKTFTLYIGCAPYHFKYNESNIDSIEIDADRIIPIESFVENEYPLMEQIKSGDLINKGIVLDKRFDWIVGRMINGVQVLVCLQKHR